MRPVDGPLVIGGSGALAEAVLPFAGKLTDAVFAAVDGQFELPRWTAEHSPRAKAVLFDASGLTRFEQLVALRDFFQPVLKGLDKCPKVVVLGRPPSLSRTRSPPACNAAWKVSPAPWARKSVAAATCSCCTSARAPRTNWKARCASSSRRRAPTSPAR